MRRKIWSARDIDSARPVLGGEGEEPRGYFGGGGAERGVGTGPAFQAGGEGEEARDNPPLHAGGEGEELPGGSDIRIKEGIQQIGQTVYELPLYRFRYKGREEEYAGVMAQDVLEVLPEAVSTGADGFYRVNYSMLGIKLVRLDDDGLSAATDGGEGSGVDQSDIHLKDRIEQIGTIEISIARRD
jgi:hypothetical protein